MASVTKEFLKLRKCVDCAAQIDINTWYDGFSAVKAEAVNGKMPLVAIWSNGDKCSHCIALEKVLKTSTFRNLMGKIDAYFWFGCCLDKTADDKFEGKGFKFCNKNGTQNRYPMVRIYWKQKKVDVVMDGDTLRLKKTGAAGAKAVYKMITSTLKED